MPGLCQCLRSRRLSLKRPFLSLLYPNRLEVQDAELPGKESVRMEVDVVQIDSKSQLEIEKLECLLSSWLS